MIDLKRLGEVADKAGEACGARLPDITRVLPDLLHFNPGGQVPPEDVQAELLSMVADIKARRKEPAS